MILQGTSVNRLAAMHMLCLVASFIPRLRGNLFILIRGSLFRSHRKCGVQVSLKHNHPSLTIIVFIFSPLNL